jgi:heme/copper-type cytochrome/quinol oxidase subunit 2
MQTSFTLSLGSLTTGLTILLFVGVAGLLGYGAIHFRRSASGDSPGSDRVERRVDMRREVLWTGVAATLLLIVFAYVH